MTEFAAEPFPDRPRMIFMGTPDFAVPTLKALIAHGHDVLAVVTQPDRPKGPAPSCALDTASRPRQHGRDFDLTQTK